VLDAKAREALKGLSDFAGRTFTRLGFTANSLTVLGVALSAVATWRIAYGAFLAGGIILMIGGVLDFCDGAVARVQGKASEAGAFFDSVTDRLSDALVFSALVWYFLTRGDEWTAVAALAAYGMAQMTSYIRARAESVGYDCKVGILERAERLIILCAGLMLWFVEISLWIIAVLGAVTVAQRLVHVSRQVRARS
jgi:CDP-diacylglycerol--glycerol-3-phosphate 3-phosphatidyltransferase